MDVKTIGVVGAGQMGSGIAQVAAQCGYQVVLIDVKEELAVGARDKIGKILQKRVDKGKLPAEDRAAVLERIHPSGSLADLAKTDWAVEAATENQELKIELFKKMDEHLPKGCVLASNTSSISITLLGAQTSRPEKVIGMHFMNPVPLMKLTEIIPGLPTDQDTIDATVALSEKMGKTTVIARDIPGFIVNRVLMPLLNEAVTVQAGLEPPPRASGLG